MRSSFFGCRLARFTAKPERQQIETIGDGVDAA